VPVLQLHVLVLVGLDDLLVQQVEQFLGLVDDEPVEVVAEFVLARVPDHHDHQDVDHLHAVEQEEQFLPGAALVVVGEAADHVVGTGDLVGVGDLLEREGVGVG